MMRLNEELNKNTYHVINKLSGRISYIDFNADYEDIADRELIEYLPEIKGAVAEQENDLTSYYKGLAKEKILSIEIMAPRKLVGMRREPVLIGVTKIEANQPLLQQEQDDLLKFLTGQFSDGWGESFEQRAIPAGVEDIQFENPDYYEEDDEDPFDHTYETTSELELYISYWSPDSSWFIKFIPKI